MKKTDWRLIALSAVPVLADSKKCGHESGVEKCADPLCRLQAVIVKAWKGEGTSR